MGSPGELNGAPRMLTAAVEAAGIAALLDAVLSVDAVRLYKPRPEVYALVTDAFACKPEEVAFVGPTSLALSFVAGGMKFRRCDNILIYFDDYPSNVYPWMALAEKGVQVRLINIRELGAIRAIDVTGRTPGRGGNW